MRDMVNGIVGGDDFKAFVVLNFMRVLYDDVAC